MICPKCEYEYVKDIKVCPDCDAELIPVEEFEGNLVHHSDWVVLFGCEMLYEAEMIKSNLEGANIEALVLNQKDRNFPTDGDLSVIKVLVQKSDVELAVNIIKDIEENKSTEGE